MDDATKLGFEFADSLAEQLITLSTGIIALTIAFIKDVLKTVSPKTASLIRGAWLSYGLSVLCGIWAKMALTGTLLADTQQKTIESNVTIPAGLQIILFLIGTLLIITGGWKGLENGT